MQSSPCKNKPSCEDHQTCIQTQVKATATCVKATLAECQKESPPDPYGTYSLTRGVHLIPLVILLFLAELAFTSINFLQDPITGCLYPDEDNLGTLPYKLYRTVEATKSEGYWYFKVTWMGKLAFIYLHQLYYILTEGVLPAVGCQLLHLCSMKCTNHITLGDRNLNALMAQCYWRWNTVKKCLEVVCLCSVDMGITNCFPPLPMLDDNRFFTNETVGKAALLQAFTTYGSILKSSNCLPPNHSSTIPYVALCPLCRIKFADYEWHNFFKHLSASHKDLKNDLCHWLWKLLKYYYDNRTTLESLKATHRRKWITWKGWNDLGERGKRKRKDDLLSEQNYTWKDLERTERKRKANELEQEKDDEVVVVPSKKVCMVKSPERRAPQLLAETPKVVELVVEDEEVEISDDEVYYHENTTYGYVLEPNWEKSDYTKKSNV